MFERFGLDGMEVTERRVRVRALDRVGPGREPDAHDQGRHGRDARRAEDDRCVSWSPSGGNALLQRGEPMTADRQRANVRRRGRAARADRRGARARRLARQRAAGRAAGAAGRRVRARSSPTRSTSSGARDRGHDRLPARAGAGQRAAVRDAARDDPDDGRGRPGRPGVRRPDEVRRPRLRRGGGATRWRPQKGWVVKPDGDEVAAGRRLAAPAADLRDPADPLAARAGHGRDLRRRRRHPDDVRRRARSARSSAWRP